MQLTISPYKQLMTMMMAISLSALSLPLYGNPQGGQVASGNITIQNNGNTVNINQTGSQGIINWTSFDIHSSETVNFNNKGGTTLNRINSNKASSINGNLNASGKIFLINPHGIVFGVNAQVNVGSIVASVADISDSNFLKGDYKFDIASTDPHAQIINHGHISTVAEKGLIALVGPGVINDGVIQANVGKVALGTGDRWTLDVSGDGLINFDIGEATTSTLYHIDNTGSIIANAGSIMLTAQAVSDAVHSVINVEGIVQARSVEKVNGKIVFGGAQQVNVSGTIDASGVERGQRGGQIQITGDQINIGANNKPAVITASGDQGGGSILIGGDMQGGGTLAHAENTTVNTGSVLSADAITTGNGGRVVVWSDNTTEFHGSISARGGAFGGDGGTVETSGRHRLEIANASVNAGSARGKNGSWLLDPGSITINLAEATSIHNALETNTDTTILAQKDTGVFDAGDIFVNSAITWDTNATLNLVADNNINVGAVIANVLDPLNNIPSGNLNLRADADANNSGTVLFPGGKVDFSDSAG
ncbi:MAG TPA: filamentous hemagglutinin N-terminal domain-containing protein, partial [Gammaproteobacteria bacterium]|nr:filamentous hemagglutinin N-terminal domain-containing protein [Gammaproteobacteria bacterium]